MVGQMLREVGMSRAVWGWTQWYTRLFKAASGRNGMPMAVRAKQPTQKKTDDNNTAAESKNVWTFKRPREDKKTKKRRELKT